MMPARPIRRLAASTILLLAFSGCGLFDLREPENPSGGPSVPFETPTEPRIALKNLKATTEARVITNFQRSLTTSYKFRFDPFEVGADTVWNLDRDIQAMTALFRNEADVSLVWTVRDSGTTGEDRFYRNLGYHLVFRFGAADSAVIAGRCTLYFRQDGVQWLIYRWADVDDNEGTPNVVTWGYARLHPVLGPAFGLRAPGVVE